MTIESRITSLPGRIIIRNLRTLIILMKGLIILGSGEWGINTRRLLITWLIYGNAGSMLSSSLQLYKW